MRLAFDDDGPGPVVVLLHGFPLDRTMWEHQVEAVGALYRVITPDLRGHGETPSPEGIYPIDDMADDVIELLDALRITEPVVLGGLSMGGYVALSIAVRHPKRLRGLMLLDTKAEADTPEAAAQREVLARTIEEAGSTAAVAEAMLPKMLAPTTKARHPELARHLDRQFRHASPMGLAGALRGMAVRPDRTPDLHRIATPTLVLAGADDAITPPAGMKTLAEALPSAHFVEVPDAGHLSPLENAEATNAAILAFFKSLA